MTTAEIKALIKALLINIPIVERTIRLTENHTTKPIKPN